MIRSLGELSGLEFVARIGIERDKDRPDEPGRNAIKAAIGPAHGDYARVMGRMPQPSLGLIAASDFLVRSPLDLVSKGDVRRAARHLGLPNWDAAASPCLRSRLAIGVEATMSYFPGRGSR